MTRSQEANWSETTTARPDVSAAYGRYAQFNPPHPRPVPVEDASATGLYPANGNTAPSAKRESSRDESRREEAMESYRAAANGEAFVAFGGNRSALPPATALASTPAAQVSAASAAAESAPMAARADDTIVVLRRETATVSFPAGDSNTAANDLIQRLGAALSTEAPAQHMGDRANAGAPAIEAVTPLQLTDRYEALVDAGTGDIEDLNSDAATADAVAMAGRLRPVQAGE